jgi:hypothetical protein
MSKQAFNTGDRVSTPKGEGEILDYKRGWFIVDLGEEEGECKFRAKDLSKVGKVKMSEQLKRYRVGYQKSIGPDGSRSMNNGDDLAAFLEGKSWEEVCKLADEVLEEVPGFHAAKYQKLNLGARRMNAGNRIRAAIKRGDWEVPQ